MENYQEAQKEVAIFASGCFWGREYHFSRVEGVLSTRVGFTGGHTEEPTYHQVCTKNTGHAEAVEITFDPEVVSYEALARLFFEWHDPTIDRRGKGGQYRSAIFYTNERQQEVAKQLVAVLLKNGFDVVTEIEPATAFWPAEARHQKYCDSRNLVPKDYYTKRFP